MSPQARAAVASATSWVAMTMSPPLCSRHSSAMARWITSIVPSKEGLERRKQHAAELAKGYGFKYGAVVRRLIARR